MDIIKMKKNDLENILGEEIMDKDGELRQVIAVTLESDDIDSNMWMALETIERQGNGAECPVCEITKDEHWGIALDGKENCYGDWIEFCCFDDFDETTSLFNKYDLNYKQIIGMDEDIEKVAKFIEDNNLSVAIR